MERTIPHLDEGTIQALVHDELTPATKAEALRHTASCADCKAQVGRAREEDAWVRARLSSFDVQPPGVRPEDVMREARRRDSSGRWRRAAVIMLAAGGAGIAWATPPVRGLITRWLNRAPSERVQSPPLVRPESARTTPPRSGISLVPGPRFVVNFEASQQSGELRLRLVDERELSVIALGAPVPFESREDELTVRNRGAVVDYDVAIPTRAQLVEIRIAGERRFLKRGARIDAGDVASVGGRYVIPLRQ